MILDTESWMNIRRFRALHAAGATFAEIGRECGCDWRTVRKYLAEDAASVPPAGPSRMGTQPLLITPFISLVEGWLRADLRIKGTVVHERLVAEHGFTGHYQRVKVFLAEARPRIAAELADRDENRLSGLHRRFEVVPGAQAQVDWGEEGDLLGQVGIANLYSFHMVLSYSRDPFCCFTTSMDLATFWDCHRRAFAHFGGVPGAIVYDRTKTVIKRHVAPGVAVPLHPEAAAFAEHYGFTIDVLAAYRPTGKGRVERQVSIVRDHVLAGRGFDSIAELDGAFTAWLPIRRSQTHRTHGQVIGVRATRIGPHCNHCLSGRMWWRRSICGGSARTVWSPSRPACTRCPPGWCGPDSGCSCTSTPIRPGTASISTPSAWTAAAGWPPIPAPPPEAPGRSTRRTGTDCPTATPAPPPSRLPDPAGSTRPPNRWRCCWP